MQGDKNVFDESYENYLSQLRKLSLVSIAPKIGAEFADNRLRISLFDRTFKVSSTGIAGPDGGTPGKPVGTTWIAIATPRRIIVKSYLFGENRERNIRKTALQALNLLRKEIGELG